MTRTNWPAQLAAVARVREPFLGCARKIVSDSMRRWLPEQRPVVEVGAGSGQLRRWLEEVDDERWIHTEPDRPALEALQTAFPEAKTRNCPIEALPFADGEVGAVVGLCVLDMLPDLSIPLREARRVLAANGRLVHMLDLKPDRGALLSELSLADKLAFPNLFGDPLAKAWPEDLVVTHQKPLRALLDELERIDHPLPKVFKRYFAAAFQKPFDAERASTELDVISRAEPMRALFRQALSSAYEVGERLNLELPPSTVVSSGLHFATRLEKAAIEAGFVVELNEVCAAWAHEPKIDPSIGHRCLALGQGRLEETAVAPCLCEDARKPSNEHELVEYGVLVLVASRARDATVRGGS